jgi:hypothetical protein
MVTPCYSPLTMRKRPLFIVLIVIALLARSAAAFAMQMGGFYFLNPTFNQTLNTKQATASVTHQPLHHCHGVSSTSPITAPSSLIANAVDSAGTQKCHSDCGQCCVPALLSQITPYVTTQHTLLAPMTVLFNSLPAPSQRPAKPPIV